MNEEFKITIPSITEAELTKIDDNLHKIVNEFIKTTVKDKEMLLSQHIIKRLEEENKKLKKIFVELAKWLKENIRENTPNYRCLWMDEDGLKKLEEINSSKIIMKPTYILYQKVLEKLNELKGE